MTDLRKQTTIVLDPDEIKARVAKLKATEEFKGATVGLASAEVDRLARESVIEAFAEDQTPAESAARVEDLKDWIRRKHPGRMPFALGADEDIIIRPLANQKNPFSRGNGTVIIATEDGSAFRVPREKARSKRRTRIRNRRRKMQRGF